MLNNGLIVYFIIVCVMGITAGLVVVFRGIPVAFAGLALAHASQLSGILVYYKRLFAGLPKRKPDSRPYYTYERKY